MVIGRLSGFDILLLLEVITPSHLMDRISPETFLPLEDEAPSPPLIARRIFNSSFSTVIMLYEFQMPRQATMTGTEADLHNQAIFGIFAMVVAFVFLALPAIFTAVRHPDYQEDDPIKGRSSSQRILDRLMKSQLLWGEETEKLSRRIGLDTTKCLERAVCEAHNFPRNKYYGVLALPFQIMFPPSNDVEKGTSHHHHTYTSIFRQAAWTGKHSGDDSNCEQKYKCFFNILGLLAYFVDWYWRT